MRFKLTFFFHLVQQYHDLIGKPTFMPIWAFGWQQTRPSHSNSDLITSIVELYYQNNISLTGIWQDYEYMDNRVPFTVNNSEISPSIIESLSSLKSKYKIKFIPVIEEGIGFEKYSTFDEGKRMDLFVKKESQDNSNFIHQNQAGEVVLVNFFHPNSSIYWENNLERLRKIINFDSIWLNYQDPKAWCLTN